MGSEACASRTLPKMRSGGEGRWGRLLSYSIQIDVRLCAQVKGKGIDANSR